MTGYMIRRFLLMILTLFGMSILIFVMLRLVPGNISDILFDSAGFVDPAAKAELEAELGLDKPIYIQYWNWISGLMVGDLGYAYVSEQPAIDEIAPRIPLTAKLAALALFFSVLFGVPLGVISAVKQDTWLDYFLRVVSLSGLSLPSFWLGLLVLTAFVQWFGWIPIYTDKPETLWDELVILSIPAAAVGFRASALIMRLTRSSMLEVMRQDYIRTARAKGLGKRTIVSRHVMRNAMLPMITVLGPIIPDLITGSIFIEAIFRVPGLGRFWVTSTFERDYPMIIGLVMLWAVLIAITYLITDILYAFVDPRVRYR